jgi:RimJ/RimL family protein N-acetyltransferase
MKLRRLQLNDHKITFIWRNDPRIWKWCRQNSPLHWDNHMAWFRRQTEDPTLSMFMAVANSSDRYDGSVGVCGLTSIDLVNRRAEFSGYVDPDQQGKGYGFQMLVELFRHGFDDLGLNRIWGESYRDNPAMKLFTEKLGMEIEGTRRDYYYRDGRFIDAHLVSISAAGFRNLHPREKETVSTNKQPTDADKKADATANDFLRFGL